MYRFFPGLWSLHGDFSLSRRYVVLVASWLFLEVRCCWGCWGCSASSATLSRWLSARMWTTWLFAYLSNYPFCCFHSVLPRHGPPDTKRTNLIRHWLTMCHPISKVSKTKNLLKYCLESTWPGFGKFNLIKVGHRWKVISAGLASSPQRYPLSIASLIFTRSLMRGAVLLLKGLISAS